MVYVPIRINRNILDGLRYINHFKGYSHMHEISCSLHNTLPNNFPHDKKGHLFLEDIENKNADQPLNFI